AIQHASIPAEFNDDRRTRFRNQSRPGELVAGPQVLAEEDGGFVPRTVEKCLSYLVRSRPAGNDLLRRDEGSDRRADDFDAGGGDLQRPAGMCVAVKLAMQLFVFRDVITVRRTCHANRSLHADVTQIERTDGRTNA